MDSLFDKPTEPPKTKAKAKPKTVLVKEWGSKVDCEHVYQLYPRKVGHLIAIKKIAVALCIVSRRDEVADPVSWMKTRVEEYAKSCVGKDAKFVPHPATWFSQGRFDDVDPAVPQKWTPNPVQFGQLVEQEGGPVLTPAELKAWAIKMQKRKQCKLNR